MRESDFPSTNDTRDVMAAYKNWVLQLGRPFAVPSKLPLPMPNQPLPQEGAGFTIVIIHNITSEQAREVQFIIGSLSASKVEDGPWGSPPGYRWPACPCSSETILLVQKIGDEKMTFPMPLFYSPQSDIKMILEKASNRSHLESYRKIGIDPSDIELLTFYFTEERKWKTLSGVPKGISP